MFVRGTRYPAFALRASGGWPALGEAICWRGANPGVERAIPAHRFGPKTVDSCGLISTN